MHPLLARQLKKYCRDGQIDLDGLSKAVDHAHIVHRDGGDAVAER